jgi:pilus assembly protein CpaC
MAHRRPVARKAMVLVAGGVVALFAWAQPNATAQPQPATGAGTVVADGTGSSGQLKLTVNKTAVISTKVRVDRVSVGQPDIADVNAITPTNVLVTAKKPGNTQIIIWGEGDQTQVIDVTVDFDLQAMNDQLKVMFPDSKIEVTTLNGAIALRGRVPNLKTAEQAVEIAGPYSNRVLNFLDISGGQQVMLQVRFAEVSRSASSALGINGAYASGAFIGGSNIGQVNPPTCCPAPVSL